MSDAAREVECRNCGRPYPREDLDRLRWCHDCRGIVVRRATLVGRGFGLLAAVALLAWVVTGFGEAPRFLIAWLILVAAVYFFVYKLIQRVAFEIIRARGVRPRPD